MAISLALFALLLAGMPEVEDTGTVTRPLVRLIIADDGKPRLKQTRAGYSLLSYDGDLLTAEQLPNGGKATYVYGWDRQLFGILYRDGTSVLAHYERSNLVALQSCHGKVIRCLQPTTPHSREFHTALAQLAKQ